MPAAAAPATADALPPIALEEVASREDLLTRFSAEHLKADLARRGLKCGGTHAERAERLWRVRGLAADQVPPALKKK